MRSGLIFWEQTDAPTTSHQSPRSVFTPEDFFGQQIRGVYLVCHEERIVKEVLFCNSYIMSLARPVMS
jgi:hypothetical protein